MNPQALPYLFLLGSLYGTTLIVSRFSIGQFAPTTYIGLRFLIASIGFILSYVFSIQGRKWPTDRRLWFHSIIVGIFGTAIPMVMIVSSLQYQSSGLTSIILTAAPAITVLLAHFSLPDEKLSVRKGIGVGLALAGAVSLAALGESGLPDVTAANPRGFMLVLVGILLGSVMTIYIRKYMRDMDSFAVSSVRSFSATLAIIPISLIYVGFDLSQVNQQGYAALAWAAAAGTFFATLLEFYIIKRFGATASALTTYIIPIVAATGGVLILDEQITLGMVFGMAVILAGIAILNQPSLHKGRIEKI